MKRDLMSELEAWCVDTLRKPLILRGARQVGKSYLVREFGKRFKYFVELNFEKEKSAAAIFQGDLRVEELVDKIAVYTKTNIVAGETLLFFDETQECPEALLALRYFKEDMPGLHVIAAGSLLEFALEKVGFPVGRVQLLHLYPLSFGEFLTVTDNEALRQYLYKKNIDTANHQRVMELLKTYLWLGGMPAVVDAWLNEKDVVRCQNIQSEIIETYKQDFNKYARKNLVEHVEKLFVAIPLSFGRKFKFVNVDKEIKSLYLKQALLLLEKAGVAHIVYHTAGHRQPLGAEQNSSRFKVFFLDVGLAQHILGLNLQSHMTQQLSLEILGSIAEQFVAQEMVAYAAPQRSAELYYWHREAKNSNAEIDFLLLQNSKIIPVEVKAGSSGTLRSLQQFLLEHPNSPYGLKIADTRFAKENRLEQIPLYGLEAWLRSNTISH